MQNKLTIKELFSKTYNLVKLNLILVQPLLIFFLLMGFILNPAGRLRFDSAGIVLLLSVCGLFCAFIAGWFNMFYKSVELQSKPDLSPEERAVRSVGLFKEFFPGVGKFFPKIVYGLVIYGLLVFLAFLLIHFTGIILVKYFGYSGGSKFSDLLNLIIADKKTSGLDTIAINQWNILSLLLSYFTMFWIQAVILTDKHPVQAYFESFRAAIKAPLTTIVIFMSSWLSMMTISGFIAITYSNIFAQFLGLMLMILTLVYFIMMAFVYFERYSNIHSGSDSIGQD